MQSKKKVMAVSDRNTATRMGGAVIIALLALLASTKAESLPDLSINGWMAQQSIDFRIRRFAPSDCSIVEGTVHGAGDRVLLRFTTSTANIGNADLFFGNPQSRQNANRFEYSPCHGHFHLSGYAEYSVFKGYKMVARGHKQAFCLMDVAPVFRRPRPAQFNCHYQGITVGWADIYDKELDGQWVDVTDLAPGDYHLVIRVNPYRLWRESNYDNNTAIIPVTIPPRNRIPRG